MGVNGHNFGKIVTRREGLGGGAGRQKKGVATGEKENLKNPVAGHPQDQKSEEHRTV